MTFADNKNILKTSLIGILCAATIILNLSAVHKEIDPKIYWSPQHGINQEKKKPTENKPVQKRPLEKIDLKASAAQKNEPMPAIHIRTTEPKLLIMMETDDASESLFASLDYYYSKLSKKGNWRILLVTKNPDPAFEEPDFKKRLNTYKNLHSFLSAPYNTMNFKDDYSDIMIMVNTNQKIETDNFDQIICKSFHYMFDDYDGFLYFDDQPSSESGEMFPVIGKMYYHMCGSECLSATAHVQRENLEPLTAAKLHYQADKFENNRFYAPIVQTDNDELDSIEQYNDEKPFVFIVPSFNNINWYQQNLDSMLSQKYKNFRIIYIDDASKDGTTEAVEAYLKAKDTDHRVTFIKNKENVGALANIYNAIQMCKSEEIIAIVDGDDWLATDKVLTVLNSSYHDTEVWMTYGQFRWWPGNKLGFGAELPYEIIEKNKIRDYQWSTTHLRTFYAWLGQQVKKESLLWTDGKFYSMTGDLALMFSVAELAGQHSKFIPQILYTYNFATPLNDQKKSRNFQIILENDIRQKQKYKPLESAPDFAIQSDKTQTQGPKKIFIVDRNGNANNEIHKALKASLEQKSYDLEIVKTIQDVHNASLVVVYDIAMREIPHLLRYPREKLALFLWQSSIIQLHAYDTQFQKNFAKIYTLDDTLIDNKTYFKLFYPALDNKLLAPENPADVYHKKLCTLIGSYRDLNWADNELYSERRRAVDFFDQHCTTDFELYGKGWEQFGYQTYKGIAADKTATLSNFRFCLCYENSKDVPGFVTNKIFDCFVAGCIPIYAGAPNIGDYVPKSCFINRNDFKSYQELFMFINNMSKETYDNYRKNIAEFLASKQAQQYSAQSFIAMFEGMVESLVK